MESRTSAVAPGLAPVDPARPPAPTIGGKRNLAQAVTQLIQSVEHDLYAEPFVGLGGIFLRRRYRPPMEIINDLDGDVANLFRVLQRHFTPFLDMLRYQVTSRVHFERLNDTPPESLTDLERAARFLYVQTVAFGGKRRGRNFGMVTEGGARFDTTRLVPALADLNERLAGVVIESLDWRAFLDRYDRPGALFYLDPPYSGTEHYYGDDMFMPDDHAEMAAKLARLKGDVILSINDTPAMLALWRKDFDVEQVDCTWTVNGDSKAKVGELIVSRISKRVSAPAAPDAVVPAPETADIFEKDEEP